MMLELQKKGTPQYQFRDARACSVADSGSPPLAVQMGLRLPLVYNTGNATDSLESIRLMNGRMDICVLDFKYRDEN